MKQNEEEKSEDFSLDPLIFIYGQFSKTLKPLGILSILVDFGVL